MTELNEQMWVDEQENYFGAGLHREYPKIREHGETDKDPAEFFDVIEPDEPKHEEPVFVSDEDLAQDMAPVVVEEGVEDKIIPGSDKEYVEPEPDKADDKPKDWENDGDHSQFIAHFEGKVNKIPKHSGETIAGCERAKAYLKDLKNEGHKAMRSDLNGVIDEVKFDAVIKKIDDMVDRLDRQIKKLQGGKKASPEVRLVSNGHCEKCNSDVPMWEDVANKKMVCMSCNAVVGKEDEEGLEKVAATPVINVYVSAFERSIVGIIINSAVSGGKNIEDTYDKLKTKYSFTPREELAIQQLVADYGYPLGVKDRGEVGEKASNPSSGESVELQTQYYA